MYHSYDKLKGLLSEIFGQTLRHNEYLEKCIIFGTLSYEKAYLFAGLDNLNEYGVLDRKYAEYFGVTNEDMISLM